MLTLNPVHFSGGGSVRSKDQQAVAEYLSTKERGARETQRPFESATLQDGNDFFGVYVDGGDAEPKIPRQNGTRYIDLVLYLQDNWRRVGKILVFPKKRKIRFNIETYRDAIPKFA